MSEIVVQGTTPGIRVSGSGANVTVKVTTGSGGGGGVTDHNALTGRSTPDQHPIGAVTGLQGALDGKVSTSDQRLSDARTPTAHKVSHATGGTDPLTPADIGAAEETHAHGAADVTSGIIAPARLGTGTADATTVLHGDGTWGAASGGASVQLMVDRNAASTALGKNAWTTYPLNRVQVNLGGGTYNTSTYNYTVPSEGLYLCLGSIRMADDSSVRSVGVGIGTTNADGPHVLWTTIGGSAVSTNRFVVQYTRLVRFNQNALVRMYIYSDGQDFDTFFKVAGSQASGQSMAIIKIAD